MALYTFECKKCHHEYEIVSMMAAKEKNVKKAKCPECQSKSKVEIFGASNFSFADPVGTDRYNNSHTYRFQHETERPGGTRDQRSAAEKASHMGTDPYPHIDDISSGRHFGEVE